jgi:hypothetical protein
MSNIEKMCSDYFLSSAEVEKVKAVLRVLHGSTIRDAEEILDNLSHSRYPAEAGLLEKTEAIAEVLDDIEDWMDDFTIFDVCKKVIELTIYHF